MKLIACFLALALGPTAFSGEMCFVDIYTFKQGEYQNTVLRSYVGRYEKGSCQQVLRHCRKVVSEEAGLRSYYPVKCVVRPRGKQVKRAMIDGLKNLPATSSIRGDEFPYIDQSRVLIKKHNERHPYSNYPGRHDHDHNDEMYKRSKRFFHLNGQFNESGATAYLNRLKDMRRLTKGPVGSTWYVDRSTRLLRSHDDSYEDAVERGGFDPRPHKDRKKRLKEMRKFGETARVMFAFNHVIELIENLLSPDKEKSYYKNLNKRQLRDQVFHILRLTSVLDLEHWEHFFRADLRTFSNLFRMYYTLRKDGNDGIPHASNLIKRDSRYPNRYYFLTPEALKNMHEKGEDLSKLDPPNSAFWTNNDVKKYDAKSEKFYGYEGLFPAVDEVVDYHRMGNGGIKIRALFRNKLGKKRRLRLRVGREAFSTVLSSRLARAVGYPVIPSAFRSRVKIKLGVKEVKKIDDKTGKEIKTVVPRTLDDFIAAWIDFHGNELGDPYSYIEQSSQDLAEGIVTLKNVCIEAYPGRGNPVSIAVNAPRNIKNEPRTHGPAGVTDEHFRHPLFLLLIPIHIQATLIITHIIEVRKSSKNK
jgi:hypothetical protein